MVISLIKESFTTDISQRIGGSIEIRYQLKRISHSISILKTNFNVNQITITQKTISFFLWTTEYQTKNSKNKKFLSHVYCDKHQKRCYKTGKYHKNSLRKGPQMPLICHQMPDYCTKINEWPFCSNPGIHLYEEFEFCAKNLNSKWNEWLMT
jgi:hypothetical protein